MKITPIPLIAAMSGKLLGEHSHTHLRTNAAGTIFICRNPTYRNPTAGQLLGRQRLATAQAQYQAIKADPERLAAYRAAFSAQSRYHRLCDFILHSLMTEAN